MKSTKRLKKLLAKGVFPKELPPCFSTNSFAKFVNASSVKKTELFTRKQSDYAKHSFVREGGKRRQLALPNPISSYFINKEIADSWGEIESVLTMSPYSLSQASFENKLNRAIGPKHIFSEIPLFRAKNRSRGRFILLADIEEFYPSSNTQNILSAFEDIAEDWKPHDLGARLEGWVKAGQRGKSLGFPIGPDYSFLMGELLLTAIDNMINNAIVPVSGIRFYDDYEFTFNYRSEAEDALSLIGEILKKYGYKLNPEKTEVLELPQKLDESWRFKLSEFQFSDSATGQKNRLLKFFDLVISMKAKHPSASILSYAISTLQAKEWINDEVNDLYFHLLLQAIMIEPGCMNKVAFLLSNLSLRYDFDKVLLEGCLNTFINEQSQKGHGHEVVWGLWLALTLGISLNECGESILKMNDPLVGVMAKDANSQHLIQGFGSSHFSQYSDEKFLYTEMWPLSYELRDKDWILDPNFGGFSYDVDFYLPVSLPTKQITFSSWSAY